MFIHKSSYIFQSQLTITFLINIVLLDSPFRHLLLNVL
jgi:hypothetical protein